MPLNVSPIKVPIRGEDQLSRKLGTIEGRVKKFKARTDRIGGALTRGVSLPLAIAGGVSIKFARDFNRGMAEVATLLPGQTKRVLELKKAVMDMAADTGISSDEIQKGLYGVISAYGDTEDTVEKLRIVMETARAGVTGGAEALDLLSGVTLAYGLNTKEAVKRAADLSFTAMRLGKTTIPELSEAILKITPYAAEFNVSQERLFGTMAHLAGVTGTTSEAGTQLASVYGNLLAPSSELKKAVGDLGFESAAAMGKMLDMDQLLKAFKVMTVGSKKMNAVARDLGFASYKAMVARKGEAKAIELVSEKTDIDVSKAGKFITRKEGQRSVLNAVGKGQERYAAILDEVAQSQDGLAQANKDYTEGVGKDVVIWDKATQKFKNFGIMIGDRLLPVISKLIDKLKPLFEWVEELDDATLEYGLKIAGLAIALGPVVKLSGNFALATAFLSRKSIPAIKGVDALSGSTGMFSDNISTLLSKKTKLGKLMTIFKGGGALVGVGAVSYAVGSMVSNVLEGYADYKEKQRDEITRRRELAGQIAKTGTLEEKMAYAKRMRKDREKIEAIESFRDVAGQATAWATGAESPRERQKRLMKDQNTALELLNRSIETELKESKIEIKFINDSNVDAEIRTEGKPTKTIAPNRGLVMDGV